MLALVPDTKEVNMVNEKPKMEGAEDFPMSEEGRLAMKQWLESNI